MKTNEFAITIFQDLDGCLADFDKGVKDVTGKTPHQLGNAMWGRIADGKILPDSAHHHILSILNKGEALPKKYQNHLKVLKSLAGHNVLDKKMQLTDKGRMILSALDKGETEEFIVDFYNSLDKMPDADVLWNYIAKHDPVILTGLPHGSWAEPQKRKWVAREIGTHVKVITCMARDKAKFAMAHMGTKNLNGAILIDDRPKHKPEWEAAGGTWITHTSAESSIKRLQAMGI